MWMFYDFWKHQWFQEAHPSTPLWGDQRFYSQCRQILQILLLISLSDVIKKKKITSVRKHINTCTSSDTTLTYTVLQRHHWKCNRVFCHCLAMLIIVQRNIYSTLSGARYSSHCKISSLAELYMARTVNQATKIIEDSFPPALVTASSNSFSLAGNPNEDQQTLAQLLSQHYFPAEAPLLQ